jgi:hypothetical protein
MVRSGDPHDATIRISPKAFGVAVFRKTNSRRFSARQDRSPDGRAEHRSPRLNSAPFDSCPSRARACIPGLHPAQSVPRLTTVQLVKQCSWQSETSFCSSSVEVSASAQGGSLHYAVQPQPSQIGPWGSLRVSVSSLETGRRVEVQCELSGGRAVGGLKSRSRQTLIFCEKAGGPSNRPHL